MALSLHHIVQAAWATLRAIAEREGPEGRMALDQSDFTADYGAGGSVILRLQFGRDEVWKQTLTGLTRAQMEQGISYDDMSAKVTEAMRKTLSLAGQVEHVRLDSQFPKSILRVDVSYDGASRKKTYCVHFKNGHVAEAPEDEIRSDLFLARCTMIYDLPPL